MVQNGVEPLETLLSEDAKAYLSRFYQIFDEMVWEMCSAQLSQSISHNFIVQMIPHHRAVIEMSKNLLWYEPGAALRKIARGIISEQTRGISEMKKMLPQCSICVNSPRDTALYQRRIENIMSTMFREMSAAPDTNHIDVDFMREMIPHHEGAIRMAETALQYELCPELVPVLEQIIRSQRQGVQEMEALLRRSGAKRR